MPYVERVEGVISGVYVNQQPGYAEEFLEDGDPEVVAFLNPEPVVDSVTARQFKMQLVIAGLKSLVDTWVSAQEEVVQVAYEYSGNFFKNEPMMQVGFTQLGFTEAQREAFFLEASKL